MPCANRYASRAVQRRRAFCKPMPARAGVLMRAAIRRGGMAARALQPQRRGGGGAARGRHGSSAFARMVGGIVAVVAGSGVV